MAEYQQKMNANQVPSESVFQIPQWQIDEIKKRKKYYSQHPEELIDWKDAQKMIKTD